MVNIALHYEGESFFLKLDLPYSKGLINVFKEGNYSCDCNRALLIQKKHEHFPDLDCGNEIKLLSIYED